MLLDTEAPVKPDIDMDPADTVQPTRAPGRYGEPWTRGMKPGEVSMADGLRSLALPDAERIALVNERMARAAVCVNAMRGIEDPAAFMRAVRGYAFGGEATFAHLLPSREGVEL